MPALGKAGSSRRVELDVPRTVGSLPQAQRQAAGITGLTGGPITGWVVWDIPTPSGITPNPVRTDLLIGTRPTTVRSTANTAGTWRVGSVLNWATPAATSEAPGGDPQEARLTRPIYWGERSTVTPGGARVPNATIIVSLRVGFGAEGSATLVNPPVTSPPWNDVEAGSTVLVPTVPLNLDGVLLDGVKGHVHAQLVSEDYFEDPLPTSPHPDDDPLRVRGRSTWLISPDSLRQLPGVKAVDLPFAFLNDVRDGVTTTWQILAIKHPDGARDPIEVDAERLYVEYED